MSEDNNVGDEVYWNDPDNDFASGYYTITDIVNDEIVVLDHNTEVFIWELSRGAGTCQRLN